MTDSTDAGVHSVGDTVKTGVESITVTSHVDTNPPGAVTVAVALPGDTAFIIGESENVNDATNGLFDSQVKEPE